MFIFFGRQISQLAVPFTFRILIWLGYSCRSANFIQLWKVENREDDGWIKIRLNLLEALYCQAFSTHHGVLDQILPTAGTDQSTLYERPSYGPNLMTPLAQDGRLIIFQISFTTNLSVSISLAPSKGH